MFGSRPIDNLFVDNIVTPLSESEATYYLREAYNIVVGKYPTLDSLAILWAQTALEDSRWTKMMSNNWGNMKKLPNIKYTSYKCNEVINGKVEWFEPYHPQTFFAAWEDHLEGASAYINFIANRPRYSKCWEQIKLGNPAQYCSELKKAGYYTASEDLYTRGVVSLVNEFKKKSSTLLAWKPEIAKIEEPDLIPLVYPDLDLDYHPEQENIKNIPVPINSILEFFIRIFEVILGKK